MKRTVCFSVVDHLRKLRNFRSIFPQAVVRVGTNSSSMVIENVKLSKGHGVGTIGTIGVLALFDFDFLSYGAQFTRLNHFLLLFVAEESELFR